MADNDSTDDKQFPADDKQFSTNDRLADLIATYKQFAAIVNDQLHDINAPDSLYDEPIRIHPALGNVINIVIYDFGSDCDDRGSNFYVRGNCSHHQHTTSGTSPYRPYFHKYHHRPYRGR